MLMLLISLAAAETSPVQLPHGTPPVETPPGGDSSSATVPATCNKNAAQLCVPAEEPSVAEPDTIICEFQAPETVGLSRIFLQGGNSLDFTQLIRTVPGGLPARSPFGTSYLTDVPMHEVAIYVDGVRMMR